MRPQIPYGVASGDLCVRGKAVVRSRSDRPSRMIVEYATNESFPNVPKNIGPAALETTDFTAKVNLSSIPASEQIFYRVSFPDLSDTNIYSLPVTVEILPGC